MNILNYDRFFQSSRLNEKEKHTWYPKPAQLSTVVLKKLIVPHLIKEFLTFYGMKMFIAVLIKARHLSLTMVTWLQSYLFKFILILSSLLLLGLRSGLFSLGFPTKPSKHSPSPLCVLHAPLVSSRILMYIMVVKFSHFSCFSFFIFPFRLSTRVSFKKKRDRTSGTWS